MNKWVDRLAGTTGKKKINRRLARCFIWNIWACHSSFNSICSLWTQFNKNDGSFTYWLNYLSVYYLLIWTLGMNCGEGYEASVSPGSLWKVQWIRSHPGSPELESYFNKSPGDYSLKKVWLLATCLSLFFINVLAHVLLIFILFVIIPSVTALFSLALNNMQHYSLITNSL